MSGSRPREPDVHLPLDADLDFDPVDLRGITPIDMAAGPSSVPDAPISSTIASSTSPSTTGADTCSICLDNLQNLAYCDPCFHCFCYPCINAWSRVNNICPLCKSTFNQIHHDIKSNSDYKIQQVSRVNRLVNDDIPSVLAAISS